MINTKLIEAAYKEIRRAQHIGDISGIAFSYGLPGYGGIFVTKGNLIARFGENYLIEPFSEEYPARAYVISEGGIKWYAILSRDEMTAEDWRRLNAWQE